MISITVLGADSTQALEEVQRRLGPDAMILSIRRSAGQVEVTAAPSGASPDTPPDRPVTEFARHLVRQIAQKPVVSGCLPPNLPSRVVLTGPPGAGLSMLAARLAAEALRHPEAARPILIAPRRESITPPGRLSGWARLMGLVPHRPVWPSGQIGPLPRPHADETQIVDLSDLGPQPPEDLAALIAMPDAALWLVMPTGLHPRLIDMACACHKQAAAQVVLTRSDLFAPTPDDFDIPAKHGLNVALVTGGKGLLDALHLPDPAPDLAEPDDDTAQEPSHDAA